MIGTKFANVDLFAKKSWTVSASLSYEYIVRYSTDVFAPGNRALLEQGSSNRRFVVFDKNVYDIYGARAVEYFRQMDIAATFCVVEANEEVKDFNTVNEILSQMEDFGVLRRSEPVIAVGGGVLLDVVGFAAGIYRRGVPYIRVPTTLLALVDASVGAKTGINHFSRRNRLGSYYPPLASYLDKTFIKSQTPREISNGLAEILKMAIIKDAELFRLLEGNAAILLNEKFQFGAVPVRVINRAITGMIEELAPNLWERNLERCVDFGHSFSPLIEMTVLPELSHGEAVMLDCIYSSFIACQRGLLDEDELKRIIETTRQLALPVFHPAFGNPDLVASGLADTMRHRNGDQNLPLPLGIGQYVFCNDLTQDEIVAACAAMQEMLG